jgi:transcriptional regulator with XRE-family HTH domain
MTDNPQASSCVKHWTNESISAFVFAIVSDFLADIETVMEDEKIMRKDLALRMGVSEGRVSQIFSSPDKIGVTTIVRLAKALGMKVAIVAYSDGDPLNEKGPILATVFNKSWQAAGKPGDLFPFLPPEESK